MTYLGKKSQAVAFQKYNLGLDLLKEIDSSFSTSMVSNKMEECLDLYIAEVKWTAIISRSGHAPDLLLKSNIRLDWWSLSEANLIAGMYLSVTVT